MRRMNATNPTTGDMYSLQKIFVLNLILSILTISMGKVRIDIANEKLASVKYSKIGNEKNTIG